MAATTMKAVGITRYGPAADVLVDAELAKPPAPAGFDILIRVHAIALNPVDFKARYGAFDNPAATFDPPKVLGWDGSGVIEAVGEDVTLFRPGDEVYWAGDVMRPGSNAQLQLVDSRSVGFKPKSLSHGSAAAYPLVSLTAWESLFDRLRIPREGAPGKTLLIVNAAGGVGSLAVQLAAKVPGLKVIGTAGKPESFEWVKKLGAHHVISHREAFKPQLEALGVAALDYVYLCHDTKAVWSQITELMAPQGAINTIVLTPGEGATLDVFPLYMKSVGFSCEAMFTRCTFKTPDIARQHQILTEVGRMVDAGELVHIESANLGPINAANVAKGHAMLEGGHVVGKLTLEGW